MYDHPGDAPWAFTGGTIHKVIVNVSGDPWVYREKEVIAAFARLTTTQDGARWPRHGDPLRSSGGSGHRGADDECFDGWGSAPG